MAEDDVPPYAHLSPVRHAREYRAYGERECVGILRDVLEGCSAMDAWMNTPVSIQFSELQAVEIKQPYRCAFVRGPSDFRGYRIVDKRQDECKPMLEDIHHTVSQITSSIRTFWPCSHVSNSGPGLTRMKAQVVDIIDGESKTGGCCAKAFYSPGMPSTTRALLVAKNE